jgi:hypothetical protein
MAHQLIHHFENLVVPERILFQYLQKGNEGYDPNSQAQSIKQICKENPGIPSRGKTVKQGIELNNLF